MKKFKKLIFALILSIMLLAPMTCYAAGSIKITNTTKYSTGSGSYSVYKYNTSKGLGFCITPNKTGPKTGATLKYVTTLNDGGLRYLLNNANSSDKTSVITTQLGIWRYYNDYKRPAKDSYKNKAISLAKEARNNKNYNTNPSISLSPKSNQLTEGENYYLSDYLTVNAQGLTSGISVSLVDAPEGAFIADGQGNLKKEFKSGDQFYILIPKANVNEDTSFKVLAKGTGNTLSVEKYKQSSNIQEIIVLVKNPKEVSAESTLSVKPVKRTCEIYNDKYYDKDGNETTKEIYSDQCEEHEEIVVPDTASNNGLLYVIIGGGLFGFVFGTLKSVRKRNEA